MNPVVPPGEGDNVPLSFRCPAKLKARIEAIAKATNNSQTDALLHLLRWAVSEYEIAEKSSSTKKSA